MQFSHDEKNHAFVAKFEDGSEGFVEYHVESENPPRWTVPHIEVPTSQRGKGVAEKLASYAFDQMSKIKDLQLNVTCTYLLGKFLPAHPQFHRLLLRK
jgi:predicted GNAT family acetyltransferase